MAEQERTQNCQKMKLSKHPDSVPLQKINFFPDCRAPLDVSDERGAPALHYRCAVPGTPGRPATRVFRVAPARGSANPARQSSTPRPCHRSNSRSCGALLSTFLAAKYDDP
jgi:hypothetical protein